MDDRAQVETHGGIITIRPRLLEGGPPGMGRPLDLDPARTAVVVVDVQRYFVETPPFTAMAGILGPLARFLPLARAAGMTVVHVTTEFRPNLEDAGRSGSRTRQMMESIGGRPDGRGGSTLVHGSWTAELPSELRPNQGDLLVVKTRFSGFCGTTLDAVLRERHVDSLIFAGGTTTVCVESTLRDAVFLEYNPLVLSDCTADVNQELHDSALARIEMFFGWVCDSSALSAAMAQATARSG